MRLQLFGGPANGKVIEIDDSPRVHVPLQNAVTVAAMNESLKDGGSYGTWNGEPGETYNIHQVVTYIGIWSHKDSRTLR